MRKCNKIVRTSALLLIFFVLFSSSAYAYSSEGQFFSVNDNQVYVGKVVPSTASDAVFGGTIEYDNMEDISYKFRFSVCGDAISLFLTLSPGLEEIELSYEGEVCKSFRDTSEKPVYIGVFENGCAVTSQTENQTNIYKIIYFEISNDTSPYCLDVTRRNAAAITLYLQGSDGTIYDLGKNWMSQSF